MTSCSRTELAALLGVTGPRITQLVTQGVLVRGKSGFDALGSAQAYIQFLQRDEATRAARIRKITADTIATEAKTRREIGRYLTPAELREIATLMFTYAWNEAQSAAAHYYYEINKTQSDEAARAMADRLLQPMNSVLRGWKNGIDSTVKALESDFTGNAVRVTKVIADIERAISDSVSRVNLATTPKPAARRKRKK